MKTQEELVDAFAQSMKDELKANENKGDWRTWNDVDAMFDELEYHKDKLNFACVEHNKEAIKEYLADCSNFLLMIGNSYNLY